MEEEKYSRLGIASFILSIVSGISMFMTFVVAGIAEASTPGGIDETSMVAILIGLSLFGAIGLTLIALGLGIGGLVQKSRKKIFAILGTVFSSLTVLLTVGVLVIGVAME